MCFTSGKDQVHSTPARPSKGHQKSGHAKTSRQAAGSGVSRMYSAAERQHSNRVYEEDRAQYLM